jgi:hypothetical protein
VAKLKIKRIGYNFGVKTVDIYLNLFISGTEMVRQHITRKWQISL